MEIKLNINISTLKGFWPKLLKETIGEGPFSKIRAVFIKCFVID